MKRILAGLAGVAALSLLGACTGEEREPLKLPSAEQFKAGNCKEVSTQILELGKFAYDNEGKKALTVENRQWLETRTESVTIIRDKAEADLKPLLSDLLQAIGFIRIRVEPTYDPKLMTDMEAARTKVQQFCVGS
jgi:hypothetical protein